MEKQKNRLEVTTLSWKYPDEWQDGFRQGSNRQWAKPRRNVDGTPKRNYFFKLPEHGCDLSENECGIYVAEIAVHVANDGNGKCEILYPDCVRSGCGDHELRVLGLHLQKLFNNGEQLHIGGGGITQIDFKKKSGEPLTDTAMEVFKKVVSVFFDEKIAEAKGIGQYVRGPRVALRSYFWSTDLNGWVAFEDRLARRHGLRPINETKSQYDKKPFELFWWP